MASIPRLFRKGMSKVFAGILPVGLKGRNYMLALDTDLKSSVPFIANHFDFSVRSSLMQNYPNYVLIAEAVREACISNHSDLLQRATQMDFCNYLAEDILVKVDRASMLNSLEVRAPLLDYRLIEFAFGKVPTHLKATHRDRKILLKRLASRVLPPEFDKKRKIFSNRRL